jgi:hypothetical protein
MHQMFVGQKIASQHHCSTQDILHTYFALIRFDTTKPGFSEKPGFSSRSPRRDQPSDDFDCPSVICLIEHFPASCANQLVGHQIASTPPSSPPRMISPLLGKTKTASPLL